jgi:1,4-dihydroxy-6-naphthoate synthase
VVTAPPLTLAYSPCPNDTFIFTPWVEGRLADAPAVVERYEDIDVLNRIAQAGEADIVKVSFHAFGHLRDQYCLLRSGGALGRGCGPLVVSRARDVNHEGHDGHEGSQPPLTRDALARATVAIPGPLTTAALLLRLFVPSLPESLIRVMPFDRILAAVRDGEVDAGLIIHESRFTYQRYGLAQVVDLGEWWEQTTGHAIPLGGIAMRRSFGDDMIRRVERAIAESVAFSYAHTDLVWPTVRRHAQEMEDDVMRQHIDLYVNEFTRDYGVTGEAAIRHLLATAESLSIIPPSNQSLFVDV